jgi:predicted nucleotidyltransferase
MFISQTREKILRLFFDNPELHIHQRGIARQANVAPHNVNKYLKEFVQDGLLIRSEISNLTLFRINPQNDFLFKVFELFEMRRKSRFLVKNKKISRMLSEYNENLIRLSSREIQMVILFGSVARGKWTKGSDIEILTVTSKSEEKRKIIRVQEEAAKEFNHILHISPVHITIDKFIEGMRNKLAFFEELWRDRIVLYNEFFFWQLIRESKF